jgi:hypothetical protein
MRGLTTSLVLLALAGAGVLHGQKANKEGADWLGRFTEPAEINISGKYNEKDWGQIELNQPEGSREVTGKWGSRVIKGVVSGRKAYLLFLKGNGKISYCAELDIESDHRLVGKYAYEIMKTKTKTYRMRLER